MERIIEKILEIFSGKNISFLVLLIITLLASYMVFEFNKLIMEDNKKLVSSLDEVAENLKKILEVLKIHEKQHE